MKLLFLVVAVASSCTFDGDTEHHLEADATMGADRFVGTKRITDGLVALYTFDSPGVGVVDDVSGIAPALDLSLEGMGKYQTTSAGWELTGETLLRSSSPALKIAEACGLSNALSVEAWVRSSDLTQSGPARMVGFTGNPNSGNFVLGQGANNGGAESRYVVRVRTDQTGNSGTSGQTETATVTTDWVHLVFTRPASGELILYVNGQTVMLSNDQAMGDLDAWDSGFTLNLGNERESDFGPDRYWLGEYALVAIYCKALSPEEVVQNMAAGY